MLSIAGVQTAWASAPTADEIRKLDQERLLQDPLLSGESGEDDMAMAQALLAERSPEDIASALVRIYRSRLPAAEEVTDPGDAGRGPREREPRADGGARAAAFGESVWFRLALGRKKNADPKWLLPMLCRRGGITKQDIGAIRIFENETKFQVSLAAAESFAAATRKADGDNIAIVRVTEGGGTERYDPVAASARAPMRKPRTAERHQPAEAPAPRREERPAVAERPARSDKPRHMGRPDRSERPAQGERSAPPAARPWGERPGKARDDRPRPAEAAKPKGKPKARDKDKGKPKWDKRPRS
jgi:ATP-dependent RNA helicase DeaD